MPKPQFSVGFEGPLYPGELRNGDSPSLSLEPASSSIAALIKLVETYDVAVYPIRPARGRSVAIEAWLYAQFMRYFQREHHPDPRRAAQRLLEQIEVREQRPPSGVLFEAGAVPYVGPGEWPFEAIDRAAGVASNLGHELP